ncbi:MAG: ferrous iron transport protein B [Desulfobacterales bacterium]|nr:ferrous iron transport protein B [Desulfobacterales bacterium]
MEATIALAGNPNSGKTTLFNTLTGARQHIGNYPGVTVEKKEGTYIDKKRKFHVVDLPGTYSLTAYSLEEVVARDYIVNTKPNMVVNIVDASNLERNLYLTLQFMEMGVPVCIALNMMDVARNRGIAIDDKRLAELMGVPVIPTVARRGEGKKELMGAVAAGIQTDARSGPLHISYGEDVDLALDKMEGLLRDSHMAQSRFPPRWLAMKFLEKDEQVVALGRKVDPALADRLEAISQEVNEHLKITTAVNAEAVIADYRFGYIRSVMKKGVLTAEHPLDRLYMSDRIDQVVTNRFFGPLIMVGVLLALYHFTFTYSAIPVGWVEGIFGWLGTAVDRLLSDSLLKSLIISGIIDGVGGVIGFVPLIMFMFLGISILEDSGYFARVAFMLDRVFRVFGLHGSSAMAFIVSGGIAGGCAVPGVMATRTLKSRRERLATLLTVPFMNCGAKLPVFALLVAAFFPKNQALMMFLITLIAWTGALLVARLLRSTAIRGAATPFVMELPPYRLPTFKGLAIHTWERTWQYIKKAGTTILAVSILLWAMMTFPGLPEEQTHLFETRRLEILETAGVSARAELANFEKGAALSSEAQETRTALLTIDQREAEATLRNSAAGRLGRLLEPVSRLAGFDWRTNIALVGGFAAKEVVVSTLGTAYSMGAVVPEETGGLASRLASAPGWSPLVAFSLIIFMIFYAPCFVAVVCISREAGSWKWGVFSVIFNTTLAFLLSVTVFQVGRLLSV